VEVEWRERGLTCQRVLNMHRHVVIGLADCWCQAKAETAKNLEEWLMCIQDFLKSREQILKKPYPKCNDLDFKTLIEIILNRLKG
jgi:hypothetical protein